ncbi:MAG: T9SS type A sorting domain-containing protein [Bacteroidetes bacterium]|nr:T9SS type A sorting domain-containing protein [Bacteroidota bacterium]
MKKNYNLLLLVSCLLWSIMTNAQVYKLHAEYKNDWYGNGYLMNEDIAGYPSVTLQADTAADQFVIESDNGFNRWRKYGTTGYDTAFPTVWYTLGITDNYFSVPTKASSYYTTRIKNVGYASTNFVVMQTEYSPVNFAASNPVTQLPDMNSVSDLQPVDITVQLSSPPSSQEKFFIRYSDDNFITSTIVALGFPGGAGTTLAIGTIPGFPTGTTIKYYAFSSTIEATQATLANDYDLITLKQSTNQGANYSYTVGAVTAKITFLVNMSNVTVSPNGVYLVGSFNNFDTLATPMNPIGAGRYQVTVSLDTSSTVYYKFLNGNSFLTEEQVPFSCGVPNGFGGFNRSYDVPGMDTDIDTVCFSKCANCTPIGYVKVTFKVNMSQETVSPDGVHIAGSFNNFNPSLNAMSSAGSNNIYEIQLVLDSTQTISYKFINGNTFLTEENVPSTCGISNGFGGYNRWLDVPEQDVNLDTVCFSACSNCIIQIPVDVTFRVNMSNEVISPDRVHIAGTFNGFDADSTLMTSLGGGIYSATITSYVGAQIQYKFINGNTFVGEETVPSGCGVSNGFGGYNRSIIAPSSNTVLPTVCFSSCTNCSANTPINVTFRVNMSNELVSPNGVHLAGTFNGFDADSTLMNPIGGNVYEAVVAILSNSNVTYKFINGDSFTTVENVPSACGVSDGFGGYNRYFTVPASNDTVLGIVCFSSCTNCVTPSFVDIHFRVNMSNETVSLNGIHIAGTFNGFDADSTAMTAIGNGVYEAVLSLDTTTVVLYKYINGNTFTTVENVPSGCGVPDGFGGYNRQLTVPNATDTLDVVCFSSCVNCVTAPALVDVTFLVDMTSYIVSPNGIHLAGTFNGFSSSATQMDSIGNNVYAVTLSLDTTATVEYKYINGNAFGTGLDETVPSLCGVPNGFGGYNRSLAVPNAADTLDLVCFESCFALCGWGVAENAIIKDVFTLSPSVTTGNTLVTYHAKENEGLTLSILNEVGKTMQVHALASGSSVMKYELSTSDLAAGIYMVQLSSKQNRSVKKFVVIK